MTGNAIWEAMSRMYSCVDELREEVTGMCYGGINTSVLAGQRENGRTFVNLFTDSIGGGGARSYRDGIDSCGNLVSPNYGIPNAERIESLFPLLYVYRRQTAETAGAGQYRGGVGLEYMVIPYGAKGDVEATFFSSGVAHPEPKGASGGSPGSVQGNMVLRDASILDRLRSGVIPLTVEEAGGKLELPLAKDATKLRPNDVWICTNNGGGGYGDPLDREPASVARDVRLALMTIEEAGRQYGVAIGASGAVDEAKTTKFRADRRAERMKRGKRLGDDWKPGLKFEGNQLFRYGENSRGARDRSRCRDRLPALRTRAVCRARGSAPARADGRGGALRALSAQRARQGERDRGAQVLLSGLRHRILDRRAASHRRSARPRNAARCSAVLAPKTKASRQDARVPAPAK